VIQDFFHQHDGLHVSISQHWTFLWDNSIVVTALGDEAGSACAELLAVNKSIEQLDIWRIEILEPENTPLEEENHVPNHHFQVLC